MDLAYYLYDSNRYDDLFILSRFMYRIGEPIVDDKYYDEVEKYYKASNRLPEYTTRTYDDDPIPYKLLEEFNLLHLVPNMAVTSKYAKDLDEDKSLSIQAVTTWEETYHRFQSMRGKRLIASLKLDGVNTKTLYKSNNLEVSLSRGRNGRDCFDYTQNICKVLPTYVQSNSDTIKVVSETFMDKDYLEVLRTKYKDSAYKTCKSSAISLLRVSKELEDYKHMKSLVFQIEGLEGINSQEQMFLKAKEMGFETTPYFVIEPEEVPNDYNEFITWFDNKTAKFYKKYEDYPSDGLVISLDDLTEDETIKNQYSSKNFAFKTGCWSFKTYYAEVVDILIEQQKVFASCVLIIKPLKTEDGCEAKRVNSYNPAIVINNNINIGSIIPFVRNSGAINTLVRGDTKVKL